MGVFFDKMSDFSSIFGVFLGEFDAQCRADFGNAFVFKAFAGAFSRAFASKFRLALR